MTGVISYLIFFLILAVTLSIAVLGLNLQWGFTGLFNAGVAGFIAVGAYTMAILTGPERDAVLGGFGLPFVVGLIGAMLAAGLAALLVGLVTLRLKGEYLAVATFGIAVSIQLVCLNWEYVTGGTLGLISIPNPARSLAGDPLAQNAVYLLIVLLVWGFAFWALERIVQSPWGRMLKAIREDEEAASSLGKNPVRIRLESFVLGCMAMGLSGALYVAFIGYVSPSDFLPIVTFQIWTMLIVGGSANNRGAVLGAIIVWGVWTSSGFVISKFVPTEIQAQGGAMQAVLIGLILVLMLLLRPRGLIGERMNVSRHAR
ncbi:ABC transporter permease [Chromatiales bacterium (ex Bugula neritina AB1)]|nr:ABC transporter permease [Chromatiales bacterium (ex Bugula neritina AB1)]